MAIKQIIEAECDAIVCVYEKKGEKRRIIDNDDVFTFEDLILHAPCFESMSNEQLLRTFRVNITSGSFQEAGGTTTGPDGLPDYSSFVQARIPSQHVSQH